MLLLQHSSPTVVADRIDLLVDSSTPAGIDRLLAFRQLAKISMTAVIDSSRMLIHALWLFAKSDQNRKLSCLSSSAAERLFRKQEVGSSNLSWGLHELARQFLQPPKGHAAPSARYACLTLPTSYMNTWAASAL